MNSILDREKTCHHYAKSVAGSARSLRDDRRKRTNARKHLIQSGLIEILDVADYRPFLVEK